MKPGKLIAVAIATLCAAPLAVYAAGNGSSSSGGTSATGKSSDNGAEAMFEALDKNKDGYLSRAEVKGTPHDKEFDTLDKNHDGKLSRAEHAAAPEHQGKSSAAGGTSSSKASSSGSDSK